MAASLFSPVCVGPYELARRVVLAPMTRLRSLQPNDTPSPMMATFYGQRAYEGGLLIAESASIARSARSYLGAPGIYTDEHVAGRADVTTAVHDKGSRILLQLIHPGRQAHSSMIDGLEPVAPSVDNTSALTALTADGWVPASPHRALELTEIPGVVEHFRTAGRRALEAGFDGVELHRPNGYLVDQFLQDGAAGGLNSDGADAIISARHADLVAFGRWFAANPDLPERFQHHRSLDPYDRSAFWGGDERGYIDYPTYEVATATNSSSTIPILGCIHCGQAAHNYRCSARDELPPAAATVAS